MTVRCDGRRGIWEGAKEAGRRGNFDAIKIGDVFEEAVGPAAAAVCRPPASGDIAEGDAIREEDTSIRMILVDSKEKRRRRERREKG